MNLRTWLLQIHLYLGLFTAPYLLILGVSSLNFNHHLWAKSGDRSLESRETVSLQLPELEDPNEMTLAMQDSLDLMGWFIPWESRLDSAWLKLIVSQFGKRYTLEGPRDGPYTFTTESQGFGHLIFGMHGMRGNVPFAPAWVKAWKYYQDLTVYTLLFWVVSGLILWFQRKSNKRLEGYLLLFFALFSLILMLYQWLIG